MDIREATPADVDAIRHVAQATWETDYPAIVSRGTVDRGVADWYDPDALTAAMDRPRATLFVAETEDGVVGFSHAVWDDDEGDVLRLYVHPDHRRGGAGTTLLERTVAALVDEGVERIRAMVLADNDVGNAFYRRFGFELVAEAETSIGDERFRENTYELPEA